MLRVNRFFFVSFAHLSMFTVIKEPGKPTNTAIACRIEPKHLGMYILGCCLLFIFTVLVLV